MHPSHTRKGQKSLEKETKNRANTKKQAGLFFFVFHARRMLPVPAQQARKKKARSYLTSRRHRHHGGHLVLIIGQEGRRRARRPKKRAATQTELTQNKQKNPTKRVRSGRFWVDREQTLPKQNKKNDNGRCGFRRDREGVCFVGGRGGRCCSSGRGACV